MFSPFKRSVRTHAMYPPGPEGVTLYAIGDIHGRLDCLCRAHSLIDGDVRASATGNSIIEIYLGDYVDRGPDSKGVLDKLIERSVEIATVLLRGNHEIIMEAFLRGRTSFENWRALGGLETILSYGVDGREALAKGGTILPRDLAEKLPLSHIRLFSRLQAMYVIGDYCFVHAGLRPGLPIDQQSLEDVAWIRDDFLNFNGDFGYIVVHGHTPVNAVELLSNRVNIDTGAYATNHLSVVRIDAHGLTVLG
jgi:serine/threonine protein phosphatase 1